MIPNGVDLGDKQYVEQEYTPSLWSRRFQDRLEVLRHHVQFVSEASKLATITVPNTCDIPYGDSERQKLDIFGTDLPDDTPILVFIHGGFWQELSREQSRYPVIPLYRSRVKTIVVGYDLCPQVTLAQIVQEILAAARYIFKYAKRLNSRGVYFAGHSAGAQLIAKLLANADIFKSVPDSNRLQGAFLVSGIYDLTDVVETSVNDLLHLSREEARRMSPHFDSFHYLRDKNLRLYIIAGEHDSFTFKKQSREFYELLLNSCDNVQNMHFELKDEMDHFNLVESFANNTNFLQSLLVHDIYKHIW